MAQCVLKETSIQATGNFRDTVVYTYEADFDTGIINPLEALATAQTLGPNPVPPRRANLSGTFLFATAINGRRVSTKQRLWSFEVSFTAPEPGQDEEQQNENPLLRPPVYNVDYQEQEYVVKQARNVTALTGGFTRPSGTLGPIVNGAFGRPDEPLIRTRRVGIITIEKNVANLGVVMSQNEDFQDTCNGDSITLGSKTFSPRRLKFEVTRSLGLQVENDIRFYPTVSEIGIYKTTDLILDNVGFHYWNGTAYVRAKDGDGNDTAEPVNLELDGTLRASTTSGPTTITYRDLEEVDYIGFFS